MSALRKPERAAIETVARHFSATWEAGDGASNATLSIAGKRIAVAVATVEQRIADRADLTGPRLRRDKVARRLIARLDETLRESVPDGMTVMLTITAPIRLPAMTAQAVEDTIRTCLARRPEQVQCEDTMHGNQIRIRLVKGVARQTPKVVGLVHNPGSDPDMLLHMTQSLLRHIGAAADRHTPARSASERWLVLIVEDNFTHIATYRQVYAQLSNPTGFAKILVVFAGGRVEALTG